MLRGELTAGAGGHANHQRNVELAARHVKDGGGVVHDLVERQQAEVDRHDLDDRTHPAHRRADSGADKGRLGKRRVADALGTELLQQSLADREASAVASDVLAHQKDARIADQRVAHRLAHRFAIGDAEGFGLGLFGAHVRVRLQAVGIDKPGQVLHRLPGAGFGELDRLVDLRGNIVFNRLEHRRRPAVPSARSRAS